MDPERLSRWIAGLIAGTVTPRQPGNVYEGRPPQCALILTTITAVLGSSTTVTAVLKLSASLNIVTCAGQDEEQEMRKSILAVLTAATALAACSSYDAGRPGYASDNGWRRYGQYDYDRPDPAYNGYYADRYYRDGPRYRERRLSSNDRVYRGENGQYYCRRSDGTTGLIVGGIVGGLLGNVIAPGGSKTLGTVLGAIGGGAVGSAVDSTDARCR